LDARLIRHINNYHSNQTNSISKYALSNCKSLFDSLNAKSEFKDTFFVIPEYTFFWISDFEISDLQDFLQIKRYLQKIGELSKAKNIRLISNSSLNINYFNSNRNKEFRKLSMLGELFDIMNLPRNFFNEICISFKYCSINNQVYYADKKDMLRKFSEKFKLLPQSVTKRLTVQNNSSKDFFCTQDLFYGIFINTGVPIEFNSIKHRLHSGGQSEEEAFKLALITWSSFDRSVDIDFNCKNPKSRMSDFFLKKIKDDNHYCNNRLTSYSLDSYDNKTIPNY
tara:strand:- start:2935 stop:3777 length:843 start_codon:yes stop_codon:yes gene_type:complete